MIFVLLRLAYPTVTNAFAALRLLPMGDRDKDAEILALRHQITVLERQLGAKRVTFAPEDRAFLACAVRELGFGYAACPYSLIKPCSTFLRRTRTAPRSATGAGSVSRSGGRCPRP
jgi:hypothetical protein